MASTVTLPAHIKRREYRQWAPGQWNWYWIADAPCGQESVYMESQAITQWATPDKIWCQHAMCDMCEAADHSISEHPEGDSPKNWFPVLWCNGWAGNGHKREGCDGINHQLDPYNEQSGDDCYWWYQGNYPNGWVYWMGDWRCASCAEKTIFGVRS